MKYTKNCQILADFRKFSSINMKHTWHNHIKVHLHEDIYCKIFQVNDKYDQFLIFLYFNIVELQMYQD